jgi:CotH kinase protein/Lamin Tail Domain
MIKSFTICLVCFAFVFSPTIVIAAETDIVINEIHYHPDEDDPRLEFVELYNRGSGTVDISGWYFSSGMDYVFPAGADIQPNSYLVVAGSPEFLATVFSISNVTGPFTGRLSNNGERVRIRNASDQIVDEVQYSDSPDWPVSPDGTGASLELINPYGDNYTPGNWRAAGSRVVEPTWQLFTFSGPGTSGALPRFYIYLLGAGDALVDEVEVVKIGEATNAIGDGSFDLGLGVWGTSGNHAGSHWYTEETYLGDGCAKVVATAAGSSLGNSLYQEPIIHGVSVGIVYNVTMRVKFLTPGLTLEARMSGSDYGVSGCAGRISSMLPANTSASPGEVNSVRSDNLPPFISSTVHFPVKPLSTDSVLVRCAISDDGGAVVAATLEYQDCPPGGYIRISDPEYQNWISLPLLDNGAPPDQLAGDGLYTAVIPPIGHRHLVRYRISAEDNLGKVDYSPYADDPQPNHAFLVYDGTEDYAIPTYWLIAHASDTFEAQYNGIRSNEYKWRGTLVFDGEVYDHIFMRLRGGVHRFHYPQRSWRFKFLIGHRFRSRDNDGTPFPYRRKRVNLISEQYPPGRMRGEGGIIEWVGYDLMRRLGIMTSKVTFIQLKVLDGVNELGQYDGDWYGIFNDIEAPYDDYLERQGRPPEGNLYKVEDERNAIFNKKTNTWTSDDSDVRAFRTAYRSLPNLSWFQNNLEIDTFIEYRSVVELVKHYDLTRKNLYFYNNPVSGKWEEIPWDINHIFSAQSSTNSSITPLWTAFINVPELKQQYENRLRELYQFMLIPEYINPIFDAKFNFLQEIAAADRQRWDYAPLVNRIGGTTPLEMMPAQGDYQSLAFRVNQLKQWILSRRSEILSSQEDLEMPSKPFSLAPIPPLSADNVTLRTHTFSDPNPGASFAASRFLIIEEGGDWLAPLWDSNPIEPGVLTTDVPAGVLSPSVAYEFRVRQRDETNKWGWWSDPYPFTTDAGPTPTPTPTGTPTPTATPNPNNTPPGWFLPRQLVFDSTPELHRWVLYVPSYVSDVETPSNQLTLMLVDQSNTSVALAELTAEGWLHVEVRGVGRSLLALRARDPNGAETDRLLTIRVYGSTGVSPPHWIRYR